VWTGAVLRGPARDSLKTYRVTVDGEIGRIEVPLAHAIQGAWGWWLRHFSKAEQAARLQANVLAETAPTASHTAGVD